MHIQGLNEQNIESKENIFFKYTLSNVLKLLSISRVFPLELVKSHFTQKSLCKILKGCSRIFSFNQVSLFRLSITIFLSGIYLDIHMSQPIR